MSKTYCSFLWNHQYIHPNGKFKFCCATNDTIPDNKGNDTHINNTSFEQVWNNDHMKETRLKMIRGENIPACAKCVLQESKGYGSMRTTINKEKFIASTNDDGSVDSKPTSLELHFGNLCNLKCKMCSQAYSNQIGKELLEIGKEDPEWLNWVRSQSGNVNNWTNNLSVEYKWFRNPKVARKVYDWVSVNIKRMSVLGGEPTVIKEFWDMIEYCYNEGTLKDKEITVVTNLTNVNANVKKWLGDCKHFTIWASVDGIGDRTEYIRYPSNWVQLVKNLKTYKNIINEYGNGTLIFSPAVQMLNIDQLDELLLWFFEFSDGEWNQKYNLSWMSQVTYPKMLDYNYAPVDYKLRIADKLESSLEKINTYQPKDRFFEYYTGHIKNLREDKIDPESKKLMLNNFVRYNDRQDQFRGKKTWRSLVPELESSILKYLKK